MTGKKRHDFVKDPHTGRVCLITDLLTDTLKIAMGQSAPGPGEDIAHCRRFIHSEKCYRMANLVGINWDLILEKFEQSQTNGYNTHKARRA